MRALGKKDIPEAILEELLAAGETHVSGTWLGRRLGFSRVTMRNHVEKLREDGFEVEAVPNRGYRLTGLPPSLNGRLIALFATRANPAPGSFHFFEEIDSTNDEVERRLAAGAAEPVVVLARNQSRGRGRFGRIWHSGDKGNFYASFGFRPGLPPARMRKFTIWMGLALCLHLEKKYGVAPRLKWPNDLLAEGRKLGGMLTEARIDIDHVRELVFGLGLNVNGDSSSLPEDLAGRAISLAELAGAPLPLNRVAADLITAVLQACREYFTGAFETSFEDAWDRFDGLRGQTVGASRGNETITGKVEGLRSDGALLLRRQDTGEVAALQSGEITLQGSSI